MSEALSAIRPQSEDFQSRTPFGPYFHLLARYLKPQRAVVASMAALLLLGIAVQLANPQVIRYFLDNVQSGGAQSALLEAAAAFLSFAFLQQALKFGANYLSESVAWKATNQLRADLASHCLRLDMTFHKRHTPGELIERIDGDVTAMGNFFSRLVVQVLGNTLLVAGILFLLFTEDLRLGLGVTVYTLVTMSALVAIQPLAVRRWIQARQASAEQYGFLEERIQGKEDIRSNGAEAYMMQRLYRLMGNLLKKFRSALVVSAMTYSVTDLLAAGGRAFGLALGAYLYMSGNLSIGGAYLVLYYLGLLSTPLHGIREQAQDLQHAGASIQRIQALFQTQPGSLGTGALELPRQALTVEFKDVTFQYDEIPSHIGDTQLENTVDGFDNSQGAALDGAHRAAPAIQNVSFSLHPEKVLGVLGRTGSGKTTLTRLMVRMYAPVSGNIILNGMNLNDLSLGSLRRQVGMVTQDVQLFQATLRDNLTFFDPSITDQRLKQVLRDFHLWEWVQAMPNGLDTRIASAGEGMSAGEAQLLALTRVFLKDPGLVILDEASSRLDPLTENLLEAAIDRLLTGRTGILIAHRLQTVARADEILILEDGRVKEYGPLQALANNPYSRFYQLLQTGLQEVLE